MPMNLCRCCLERLQVSYGSFCRSSSSKGILYLPLILSCSPACGYAGNLPYVFLASLRISHSLIMQSFCTVSLRSKKRCTETVFLDKQRPGDAVYTMRLREAQFEAEKDQGVAVETEVQTLESLQ